MNRPKRYISRESLDEETVAFDVWEWYYEEQPWVAKRIEKLEGDIRMLERLSPYAAINYIRKAIGYDEFCTEYADYRRIKADDLFDVLDELLDAAREYKMRGLTTLKITQKSCRNFTACRIRTRTVLR